jgi:hypothetical protein
MQSGLLGSALSEALTSQNHGNAFYSSGGINGDHGLELIFCCFDIAGRISVGFLGQLHLGIQNGALREIEISCFALFVIFGQLHRERSRSDFDGDIIAN